MRLDEKDPRWNYHPIKIIQAGKSVQVWFSCIKCASISVVDTDIISVQNYLNRVPIQDALDKLSPDQCELFLSGYCATCWNDIFKGNTS